MHRLLAYLWKDKVFIIAFFLALISCFIVHPSIAYLSYINYKVLIIMFTLMIAVAGLYEANVFSFIAIKLVSRFYSIKWIALVIVLATFFLGMWVTNDAVLLTLVPFTLFVTKQTQQEKYALTIVILQTLAANLGSALTPMGDPQNIYLYAYYNIPFASFIGAMLPITITGLILLTIVTLVLIPSIPCHTVTVSPKISSKKIYIYLLIFINALLAVLRIVPEWYTFGITVFLTVIFSAHLLKKVDYTLLLTFFSFFIFTGNLGQITVIKELVSSYLENPVSVYFSGLFTSQFISNVPSAVLLSTFTDTSYWKPLLQGVNVGSMGTLIASLASLITFKFVIKDFPDQGKTYVRTYTLLCIIFVLIITGVVFIFSNYI
jgi:Na+/H+ antiporter NhaD/arsenite permease-like protein